MLNSLIVVLGASGGSEIFTTMLQFVLPGILSVIVVLLTNHFTHKTKKEDTRTDIYKTELEQLNEQRKQVSAENDKLREDLKEELDDCRRLRQITEETLEDMKKRMNTVEAELFAWRMGQRSPEGYMLIRVNLDAENNRSNSDNKKGGEF